MGILIGKKVVTFGDSIVDGHLYKKAGFMEFVAEQEGMSVRKYANNGACVMPGSPIDAEGLGGMILEDQIKMAAEDGLDPDYVVFDGGTNDAYGPVMERLGSPEDDSLDTDTFAGAFRRTIDTIQRTWERAKVVYVAAHRLGYRDRAVQEALHRIEMTVCARMGVTAADLYADCALDTADEAMCRKYSFDVLKDGIPAPGENPTGTHPNFEAVREFYLPFVSDVLKKTEQFRFREIGWDAQDHGVMLYWELPEQELSEQADTVYEVWVNGAKAGETGQSHYSIEGLEADTDYEVCLRAVKGAQELQKARFYCRTKTVKERIDVTRAPYYAKGDGRTVNTEALQRAIDDCGADQAVYFPEGIYMTGSLRLHSDMELYLDQGAVLKGTAEPDDYLPRIWSRFEGTEMECLSGLLNLGEVDHTADAASRNVVIRGGGTIEGGGRLLAERVIEAERERLKDYLEELGSRIQEYENADTIPGRVRPRLFHICNAENISISGVTLKNGASWNVHMIYSQNIVTYSCHFQSRNIWNGDGWDPDSSRNCTIFNCTFDTGDDAVAVKAGKNPEGNVINRPCEHIRIFDCKCLFGHGFALGSEMSGGIRDVKIWNCDLEHSANGIEIKATRKRGGYVKEIHAAHCIVPRLLFHSVGYNDDGIAGPHPPVFENCSFTDIDITRSMLNEAEDRMEPCEAMELCGFEEKEYHLRNVAFRDIRISGGTEPAKADGGADKLADAENAEDREQLGIHMQYCQNVTFKNVKSGFVWETILNEWVRKQ